MQQFPLFSTVILTKDFPQYQFMKGDVATVIEFIEPNGYILEVFDNQGDTLDVIPVLASDIALPKPHAVVNYRDYASVA
jgi:Domain of unknown function (DUF4926)